jgi:hypothetical protein
LSDINLEEQIVIPNPIVEELPGWEPPPVPDIEEFPYEDIIEFQRDRQYVMSPLEERKYDAIYRRLLKEHGQISEADAEEMAYDFWTRWKIETDLFFFGDQVLGWWEATDRYGKRHRVDPELHRWLCQVLAIDDDVLILVPRLHLKTTWVKLKIVQLILLDPNTAIGLFSITDKLVQHELKDIARILSTPILRRLWGPHILPEPGNNFKNWERMTATELTVKRDPALGKPPQEPQVFAAGLGTHIVGFHFKRAFMDDIIDDRVVRSPSLMDQAVEWWQYMAPILEVDATTTMTGTPYHYSDLYAKIRRERQFDKIFVRSCREKNAEGLLKPIYKTWFTEKDLKRMERRMGPYKFQAQFNCNAEPLELKPFPPPLPTYTDLPVDEKGYTYYCLIDPAATVETYSDETAFTIAAVNHVHQVWVTRSFAIKRKGDIVADTLIQMHLMYNFKKVDIELGLQEHLRVVIELKERMWETENRRKLGLSGKIEGIPVKKIKKAQRIMDALGPLVRENKIRIHESCTELLDQMDRFTGRETDKDDLIDSLSMIVYAEHHGEKQAQADGLGEKLCQLVAIFYTMELYSVP